MVCVAVVAVMCKDVSLGGKVTFCQDASSRRLSWPIRPTSTQATLQSPNKTDLSD